MTVSVFNKCAADFFFDLFYFKPDWSNQFYERTPKYFPVIRNEIFPPTLLKRIVSTIHYTAH
jgi:hypothetical protein